MATTVTKTPLNTQKSAYEQCRSKLQAICRCAVCSRTKQGVDFQSSDCAAATVRAPTRPFFSLLTLESEHSKTLPRVLCRYSLLTVTMLAARPFER